MKILLPTLNSLSQALGTPVYVVGGYVRDHLLSQFARWDKESAKRYNKYFLGLKPYDIDVVADIDMKKAEKLLVAEGFKVSWINKEPGTISTSVKGWDLKVELTQTRSNQDRKAQGGPIEEDLMTRDFTMNAIAWNPGVGYIDPSDGRKDIKDGILRFVGHPRDRLDEDPRRWFRAYRFKYGLDLDFEMYTALTLEQFPVVPRIKSKEISVELAMTEIIKLWERKEAKIVEWGKEMYKLNVFQELWPEFAGSDKLMQNPEYHSEGDVLTHILEATERAEPADRIYVFHHDIGKPATAEWDERGWYTFYRHGSVGKDLMTEVGKRLHLSNKVIEKCKMICYCHMKFPRVEELKRKHIAKFQVKVGGDENLELLYRCVKSDIGDRKSLPQKELFEPLPPEETGVKLDISGLDLITSGIPQGPEIGRRLNLVKEAILETGRLNREEQLKIALGG